MPSRNLPGGDGQYTRLIALLDGQGMATHTLYFSALVPDSLCSILTRLVDHIRSRAILSVLLDVSCTCGSLGDQLAYELWFPSRLILEIFLHCSIIYVVAKIVVKQ